MGRMSMCAEVAAYLDTEISTLTAGTNLFAVEMPPEPALAVCLYEYDGMGEQDTLGSEPESFDVWMDLRVQVQVRGPDYLAASAMADLVHDALKVILDTSVGGHTYHRVQGQGSWTVLEIDSKARVRMKHDYHVWRAA